MSERQRERERERERGRERGREREGGRESILLLALKLSVVYIYLFVTF